MKIYKLTITTLKVVRDANGNVLNDGDTIDCRAEGIGAIGLKSKFVKKA